MFLLQGNELATVWGHPCPDLPRKLVAANLPAVKHNAHVLTNIVPRCIDPRIVEVTAIVIGRLLAAVAEELRAEVETLVRSLHDAIGLENPAEFPAAEFCAVLLSPFCPVDLGVAV